MQKQFNEDVRNTIIAKLAITLYCVFLFAITLLLVHSTSVAAMPSEKDEPTNQAKLMIPRQDCGLIYVLRDKRSQWGDMIVPVHLDSTISGDLDRGTFLVFEVVPGKHQLKIDKERYLNLTYLPQNVYTFYKRTIATHPRYVELDVEIGKIYTILIGPYKVKYDKSTGLIKDIEREMPPFYRQHIVPAPEVISFENNPTEESFDSGGVAIFFNARFIDNQDAKQKIKSYKQSKLQNR